jgi:CheY-like chemotaxis protein
MPSRKPPSQNLEGMGKGSTESDQVPKARSVVSFSLPHYIFGVKKKNIQHVEITSADPSARARFRSEAKTTERCHWGAEPWDGDDALGPPEQSGGYIWVSSESKKGTTFKLYLPKLIREEETTEEKPEKTAPGGGSETILVVEDDAPVRRVTRDFLTRFGYRVLEAGGADEAIRRCREAEGAVDLLLTDVVMPSMNGKELADMIHATYPGIKVLFTSGYTEEAIARHGVLEPGVEFIEKPFTPEALARKVPQVLDKGK